MKHWGRVWRSSLLAILCSVTMVMSSVSSLAAYADNGDDTGENASPAITVEYDTGTQQEPDGGIQTTQALQDYLSIVEDLTDAANTAVDDLSDAVDDDGNVSEENRKAIEETITSLDSGIDKAQTAYEALSDNERELDDVKEASAMVDAVRDAVKVLQEMIANPEEPGTENPGESGQPENPDSGIALLDANSDAVSYGLRNLDDANGTCSISQIKLVSGAAAPETLVIPEEVTYNGKTYTVTDISGYSNGLLSKSSDFENTTAIVLPATLTQISAGYFNFPSVEEITIPGNVRTFKGDFQNSGVKSLVFEEGVEEILGVNSSLVSSNVPLTSISFPDTLKRLEANLASAIHLERISIPDGCDLSDAENLFAYCTSLKEVTLPSATSAIPWQAFYGCTALESVTANGTITEIGGHAFDGCTALTEIPDLGKVTEMGSYAFNECRALAQEVDLSSLNEIPEYAFTYTQVIVTALSRSLTSIGDWAFVSATINETSEDTLELPSTLTTIGNCVFWNAGLPAKVVIPDSVTAADYYTFGCARGMEEITIGSGLTTIPEGMFYEVSSLKKIIINNSKDQVSGTENLPEGVEVIYLVPSVDADNDRISDAADAPTLQEAVNAAEDGETITIEKNILLGSTLNIPDGKNITIASKDGATHTILADKESGLSNLIDVEQGARIQLRNVNIMARNLTGSAIDTAGEVTLGLDARVYLAALSKEKSGVINVHGSSAALMLQGGTVDRNGISGNRSAAIRVSDGASITIEDGKIADNTYSEMYNGQGTAGLLLDGNATGTMSGGTISGNTARRGAAVSVYGSDSYNRTRFELTGGSITNNTNTDGHNAMSSAAGAVYVSDNAEMTMTGGVISGNSGGAGGGVAVSDWKLQNGQGDYPTVFVMNGGSILDNHAVNGGGIYSYSNGVELHKGTISGNTASNLGGGVYGEGNSEHYSTLVLTNVSVRDNNAEIGGGLWLCPTGDAQTHVKNGGIIYHNNGNEAADDVASARKFGGNYSLTLENRVLGGGKVEWHQDGVLYGSTTSSPYPKATGEGRYTEGSEALDIVDSTDYESVKAVIAEADITKANAQARLIIENNTAENGGGIAANGGVEIGDADPIKVTVNKVWRLSNKSLQTNAVQIQLLRDDKPYGDAVTLSDTNAWTYAWENLEGGYDWNVKELDEDGVLKENGIIASVDREDAQGEVTFTVTNSNTDKVSVRKVWQLDDGGQAADSVTVQLLCDGKAYGDPVRLHESNAWSYTWKGLETGHTWTVEETNVPEGFTASISGSAADGYVITNDDIPEETVPPETPDKPHHHHDTPGKPQTPGETTVTRQDEPVSQAVQEPVETQSTAADVADATGDSSPMMLYGAMAVVSAILLAAWTIRWRYVR